MLDSVRALYAQTADHYQPAIAQPMEALARSLAAWMARCVRDNAQGTLHDPFDLPQRGACPHVNLALDVGTGTGILARYMAGFARRVIGVDISAPMLALGQIAAPNIALCEADLHRLPLPAARLDLIGASFGLNHGVPQRALPELARVLRPNGLLICQEWGAMDDLSYAFEATFAEMLENLEPVATPALDLPDDWQTHLQDAEDYYVSFKEAGFSLVWARESPFVSVTFPSEREFVAYKLAWASRRLRFERFTEDARRACLEKLYAALAPYRAADGKLIWQPPLIRLCAIR
ncbi:MAG: class I SAM-dependent methyltransferase [Aggregatilineales bacterium]